MDALSDILKGMVKFQILLRNDEGKKTVKGAPADWQNLKQSVYGTCENFGILTGEVNGVIVVDVDQKPGEVPGMMWFEEVFGKIDDVGTFATETLNGGYHVYFKYAPEIPKIIHRKDMGIDILSNKACVFEGKGYNVVSDCDIRELSFAEISKIVALTTNRSGSLAIVPAPPRITAAKDDAQLSGSRQMDPRRCHVVKKVNKLLDLNQDETVWDIEKVDRGWKAVPQCRRCLVDPCKEHSQSRHSTLFINTSDGSVVKTCFACGSHCLNRMESKKVINVFNCMLNIVDKEQTSYQSLVTELIRMSSDAGFKREKKTGNVYKPVKPYAYVVYKEPMDYLNELFMGDTDFKSHPNNMDNLVKFMKQYDDPIFPFLVYDDKYIGFSNGVLNRITCEFVSEPSGDFVCAKYFDMEFTGSVETPMLDRVLDYQFDDKVRDFIYMSLGRMFGIRDNYGYMLYLLGEPGCGKSLVLDVLCECFNRVGAIGPTFEEKFGLSFLYDKDIVVCDDLPKSIAKIFPQQTFQTCVTGGKVPIAVKGGNGFTVDWRVPMLWAGNWLPDYRDKGQISRRMLVANFAKTVRDPDVGLKKRILETELAAFVYKCLVLYRDFLNNATSVEDVWSRCPDYFLDEQHDLKMERNPLFKFLSENTRYVKGKALLLEDVRVGFSRWLGKTVKSLDNGTFGQVNREYGVETLNMCKYCVNEHRKGCCDLYDRAGKTQKKVARNVGWVTDE